MTDDEERVVKFRPRPPERSAAREKDVTGQGRPGAADSDKQNPADAYRQRLIANLAATAFAVILTAIGVWLATSLTHMRQTQDCMMMGLRDCSRISGSAPNS